MMPITILPGVNHLLQLRVILTDHGGDGKNKLLFTFTSIICQKNFKMTAAFQRQLINLHLYFLLHVVGDFLGLHI